MNVRKTKIHNYRTSSTFYKCILLWINEWLWILGQLSHWGDLLLLSFVPRCDPYIYNVSLVTFSFELWMPIVISFGSFNCPTECNSPCLKTWELRTTSGFSDPPLKDLMSLSLFLKRNMEFVRCEACSRLLFLLIYFDIFLYLLIENL